uniref:Uncharacterized protein n=1 Tax=Timema poppense TaxID=170557 RepID=A0A7R9DUH7_TIMPO|nr:unnamed protein product [Timema poppensis]
MTTPPLSTAPALAIGSRDGHCLSRFPTPMGSPCFLPLGKARRQWRVYETSIFIVTPHPSATIPYLPSRLTLPGQFLCLPPRLMLPGLYPHLPPRLRVAGTVLLPSNLTVPSDGDLTRWDTPAAPTKPTHGAASLTSHSQPDPERRKEQLLLVTSMFGTFRKLDVWLCVYQHLSFSFCQGCVITMLCVGWKHKKKYIS